MKTTKEMKHTPEPWKIYGSDELPLAIIQDDEDGMGIIEFTQNGVNPANAKRIVSCVNACQGIEDPETTIKELIEMLGEVLDVCELNMDDMEPETIEVIQKASTLHANCCTY